MIERITFSCETITPMFCYGADGKIPDVRPPSIKGALRFWWRAANGHLPIDELREKEAEIFGGSGEGQGRSKVSVRITNQKISKSNSNLKDEYKLNWFFNGSKKSLDGKDAGIAYLLYSTLLSGGKKFIKEGSQFTIEFSSYNRKALKNAISAFWLLTYFGTIGTRSRRGVGSFRISDIKDSSNILQDLDIDFILNENDNIQNWLSKNYKKIADFINENNNTDFVYQYSNLSFSRFIISKTDFSSWKDALNDIGKIFRDFRTKNKYDIFGTSAFGLPRKHIKKTSPKEIKRRNSPIVIKILKIGKKYKWLVLRFAGEFLPENIVLKDEKGRTQKPDYGKINIFWNELKNNGKEQILHMPDRLEEVKNKIIKEFSPNEIILFGSKASGNFHKKSDIDIAIKNKNKNRTTDSVNGNIDIVDLICPESIDFRQKIEKEGVKIWQKD